MFLIHRPLPLWRALVACAVLLTAGAAMAAGSDHVLENKSVAWRWNVVDGKIQPAEFDDKINHTTLALTGPAFRIVLADGTTLNASDFTPVGAPVVEAVPMDANSPTEAMHLAGRQLVVKLAAPQHGLQAEWRVVLRRGATYVRQILSLTAAGKDVQIQRVVLFDQQVAGAATVGTVSGSPVVSGTYFIGYEHPMAENTVAKDGTVMCSYQRNAVLKNGETLTQSAVLGTTPAGQLRRGFLAYIERERAHPYRPFLHYNSWYDISYGPKYTADQSVDAINQVGHQLFEKRGVQLDSYLFDDGWDDYTTLWKFNSGFPDGFTPLTQAAAKYHTNIGVWLSPFGGYADARTARLEYGRKQGFETDASGFSLAGPKYYERFSSVCLNFVRKYHVNQFKFDGLAANKSSSGQITRDGDAMLRLIAQLRGAEPDIYINQTTGTWPSPFWLLYVDSTWRGGDDHSFAGKGDWVQKWMTYRDSDTYNEVVRGGPLYPLNALMLHGIIYAAHANHLKEESDSDFADQVRNYFGNGTQLQEMYITPKLLNQQNWDDLAEAAKWSRANADVLVDTHWIGGDPAKAEVYGWASWSPRKGILSLRNPDDQPKTITIDVKDAFQLPSGAKTDYVMHSPWKQDAGQPAVTLKAGQPHTFTLRPFQTLVLESQ